MSDNAANAPREPRDPPAGAACSFCRADGRQAGPLVAAPGGAAYISRACARIALDVIREHARPESDYPWVIWLAGRVGGVTYAAHAHAPVVRAGLPDRGPAGGWGVTVAGVATVGAALGTLGACAAAPPPFFASRQGRRWLAAWGAAGPTHFRRRALGYAALPALVMAFLVGRALLDR